MLQEHRLQEDDHSILTLGTCHITTQASSADAELAKAWMRSHSAQTIPIQQTTTLWVVPHIGGQMGIARECGSGKWSTRRDWREVAPVSAEPSPTASSYSSRATRSRQRRPPRPPPPETCRSQELKGPSSILTGPPSSVARRGASSSGKLPAATQERLLLGGACGPRGRRGRHLPERPATGAKPSRAAAARRARLILGEKARAAPGVARVCGVLGRQNGCRRVGQGRGASNQRA